MSLASGDVFIRTSTRRNSAGVPVRYLQLVHNTWDPVARVTKAKVLHSFGREDEVDRAGIERLIASLTRLLDSTAGLGGPAAGAGGAGLEFGSSRAVGGGGGVGFVSARARGAPWAWDGLGPSRGLEGLLPRLLAGPRRDERTE